MGKVLHFIFRHKRETIIFSLGVALLLVHLATLLRWPAMFVDEAWYANRAWGYLNTGIPFGSMDFNLVQEIAGYENFYSLVPVLIQALAIKLAGKPDPLVLRLVSLTGGLLLLLALYRIGKSLADRTAGVYVFFLTGTSMWFYCSAHLARADIFVAAAGYWAIAFTLQADENNIFKNVLAGLLVGIAVEIHPVGIIFGPTILVARLQQDRWRSLKNKGLWAMVGGLAVGAFCYMGLHVIPSPQAYSKIMQLFFPTHRPPILTLDPKVILDAARNTLAFINKEAIAQLVLLPISFLIIFSQRLSDMRIKILLVALVMVPILTFLFFVGRPTFYYLILITPLFDLVVGVMLSKILWHEMLGNRLLKPVVALIYGIVLICYLPFTLLIFQYDHWPPYVSTMSHVQSYIRSGDRIMGDQIFWFGLYDHHYDCWEELTYFHHLYPDSTLEQALAYFKPDIFILDSKVFEFINEKPKDDILYKNLWIPVGELKEALDRHETEVTCIESNLYDEVYIYRLSW